MLGGPGEIGCVGRCACVGCTGWVAGPSGHVISLLASAGVAPHGVCADRVGSARVGLGGAFVLVNTALGRGATSEWANNRGQLGKANWATEGATELAAASLLVASQRGANNIRSTVKTASSAGERRALELAALRI